VFFRLRGAAAWFTRQRVPAARSHQHRAPKRPVPHCPIRHATTPPYRFGLRPPRPPEPAFHGDDVPLVRPYVLTAEEWAGRRGAAQVRAVVCAL